jgi:DNA repair protein RecO (recombination protein O)
VWDDVGTPTSECKMPLAESEAVILHARPSGEADKLVSFFSRRFGRLRGVAPNARRSRRRFGAALEPLSHVQVSFYERPQRELVRLSEAELVEAFWEARGDYERSVALNLIAELADLLLPEREPQEKAYRLLLAALRAMKCSSSVWLPLAYYTVWMVRLAGWLPPLGQCSHCGRALGDGAAYVGPVRGEVFCTSCRRPGLRLLSAANRRAAAEILTRPLARLSGEGWNRERAGELLTYLLDLVESQGEHKLTSRGLLDEKRA